MGPFELQVRAFADLAKGNADQVVRQVVLEVYGKLIERSPVKTGRFRANFIYASETMPKGTVHTTGTVESPTPEPDGPDVSSPAIGRIHYAVNNLAYAPVLERGSSKQAPLGIVGITALEFNSMVRQAVSGLGYGHD